MAQCGFESLLFANFVQSRKKFNQLHQFLISNADKPQEDKVVVLTTHPNPIKNQKIKKSDKQKNVYRQL